MRSPEEVMSDTIAALQRKLEAVTVDRDYWKDAAITLGRHSCGEADATVTKAQALQNEMDAARYRWWRARWTGPDGEFDELNEHLSACETPEQTDAAIDAAIRQYVPRTDEAPRG